MADGEGLTVTRPAAMHPAAVVYSMLTMPPVTPVTIPVTGATVATEGVTLLQVPPGVALPNVMVLPAQITPVPVTGDIGLTVKLVVALQPPDVT